MKIIKGTVSYTHLDVYTRQVIVSGETSIGYTGFENIGGMTVLSSGFPYKEAPKTYIRKLTLAPSVEAFQLLRKGDSITPVSYTHLRSGWR